MATEGIIKMKKVVVSALSALVGAAFGAGSIGKIASKENNRSKTMSDKHFVLFMMMNQWVKVKQEGKNLSSYFEKNGYRKIAIYGMSYAGETLLEELKNSEITVSYGIDKNSDAIYADVDIVSMDDELGDVDAIVVTAITYFDEIADELSKKISCPIVSLDTILYEV